MGHSSNLQLDSKRNKQCVAEEDNSQILKISAHAETIRSLVERVRVVVLKTPVVWDALLEVSEPQPCLNAGDTRVFSWKNKNQVRLCSSMMHTHTNSTIYFLSSFFIFNYHFLSAVCLLFLFFFLHILPLLPSPLFSFSSSSSSSSQDFFTIVRNQCINSLVGAKSIQ